ncbi:hypothetical protein ACHAXR_009229, partial [Thalassiosira sp. AJA248-18]
MRILPTPNIIYVSFYFQKSKLQENIPIYPLFSEIIKNSMNLHYGKYDPVAARSAEQYPRIISAPIDGAPTCFDVLNGRGPGVLRHPGNAKYRTSVLSNKGLYARCPKSDKAKISKGIVAAVRKLGGRFLELDKQSGIYRDIGDQKAYEKTSQALREGQTKIRKQMYSKMASSNTTSSLDHQPKAIPPEGYFGHSVQLLESQSDELKTSPSPPSSQIAPRQSLGSEESSAAKNSSQSLETLYKSDGSATSQSPPTSLVISSQSL